jgi:hypothetical protein
MTPVHQIKNNAAMPPKELDMTTEVYWIETAGSKPVDGGMSR